MQTKIILAIAALVVLPGVEAFSLRGKDVTALLDPYDPIKILCTRGKESPHIENWCKQWVTCIQGKASPAETPAAVMSAWKPATCKEVCGNWPHRGLKLPSLIEQGNSSALSLLGLDLSNEGSCQQSCANFQKSLSTCVSMILYDQGQIASMGAPKAAKKAAAICTEKKTPCMPDLPIRHQKCAKHRTQAVIHPGKGEGVSQECKLLESNMEDCKDCPALNGDGGSQYAAFTGGCMDQLNAYWTASNYGVAGQSAIPAEQGCKIHTASQLKEAQERAAAEAAAAAKAKAAAIAAAKAAKIAEEKAAAVAKAKAAAAKKALEEQRKKLAAAKAAAEKAAAAKKAAMEAKKKADAVLAAAKKAADKKAAEVAAKKAAAAAKVAAAARAAAKAKIARIKAAKDAAKARAAAAAAAKYKANFCECFKCGSRTPFNNANVCGPQVFANHRNRHKRCNANRGRRNGGCWTNANQACKCSKKQFNR